MTEKQLIQYKVLCDEDEEVARILFEIVKTGEEIEGHHQIQEWVNNLYAENEQLQEELKEFKDFVYSDEKILCYTCVNCLSKGIYQIECSEKGKVDVHGSCLSYWRKEVE